MLTVQAIARQRHGRAMLKTWQERQGKKLDNDRDANMKDAVTDLLHAAADQGLDPRDVMRVCLDHFEVERPDLIAQFDLRAAAEMSLDPYAVSNGYVFYLTGGKGGMEDFPGVAVDANGCPEPGFYFYVKKDGEKGVFGPYDDFKAATRDRDAKWKEARGR
jgi:hypothetical protein